jgi:serine/threonine-protein kinase
MAPEQEAGEPAAPGMDLFALGALLHELATGERPGGQAAPHGALGEVVRRLVLPDPAERPAAAGEVLGALVAALPGSLPGDERPWPAWADRLLGAGEPAMAGPAGR